MGYDATIRAHFRKPASLDVEVRASTIKAILSRNPDELDRGQLSIGMEATFEQCMYFVPSAIHYIEQRREEWPQTGRQLLVVLAGRVDRLTSLGFYEPTLNRIAEAFQTLTSTYQRDPRSSRVARSDFEVVCCIADGDNRGDFVDSLWRNPLPYRSSTLFNILMHEWIHSVDCWERSATLLDLLIQVDWSIIRREVFLAPEIVALRRDRELCRQHFALAKDHIRAICPTQYYDYLVEAIAGCSA